MARAVTLEESRIYRQPVGVVVKPASDTRVSGGLLLGKISVQTTRALSVLT
jgi:hypothetical protein